MITEVTTPTDTEIRIERVFDADRERVFAVWTDPELIPEWWGLTLTITYLAQALVSALLERRFEQHMLRSLFWMIWYPLAFWMISTATTVAALPIALLTPRKERTTWISPDRGLR